MNKNAFHVLFVCTGNYCRSPIAEALFKQGLQKHGIDDSIIVSSAGLSALDGYPASEGSCIAVTKYDATLSDFVARQLTAEDIRKANIVFVMEHSHQRQIVDMMGDDPGNILLLNGGYRNRGKEIIDPVHGSQGLFDEVATVIFNSIEDILSNWETIYRHYSK